MPILTTTPRRCLFAVVAMIALGGPVSAQTNNIRLVHRFRIKPDRMADARAILREANAVLQKEKFDRESHWYESLTGPTEIVWVRHFKNFAEAGATNPISNHPAIAALSTRLGACIESREILVDEIMPDMSVFPAGETAPMVSVLTTRVHSGKGDDYVSVIRSELLPAVKKSGAPAYIFSRRRVGGPLQTYTSVRMTKGWGDLDGVPDFRKAMGEAAYQKFVDKRNAMVVESEMTLYRLLQDASYRPR
jgi:hypothetical protein